MTVLDVIGGLVLALAFVLSSSALAVGIGGPHAVPLIVRRFMESSSENQGLAPPGKTWLALLVFGVVAIGILVAEAFFFLRQAQDGSARALVPVVAFLIELAWLAALILRRKGPP